ncbi:deoxyribonuclease II [Nesidiocoris tenuis]|uniref:Deoxyribonuclease II n=1 Tax=Nesidiocoris tenuis TaxID=355587 RepID=A0ABN7AMS9_9HEMI|nr:deoxyribonuclease II [Nesidiocoris tenuis]
MKISILLLGILFGFGAGRPPKSSSLQCVDENGNNVDWYVVYKFPETYKSPVRILNGAGYMYITSDTVQKGWQVSSQSMENSTNLMARTIENMYQDKSEELWLVYNDQMTKYSDEAFFYSKYGHTKGVVGADTEGGFWLVHSIPHFPTLESYEYPKTALRYGQSALCISMGSKELDKIGNAFKYNQPDFTKAKYSDELGAKFPTLKEAAEGGKAKKAPWYYDFQITSKGGVEFHTFAKGWSFGKDLYEWIASSLDADVYAETWQNEPGPLPASCSIPKKVMNVKEVAYKNAQVDFSSHKDHSKWAISTSSAKPYVCIGDINRAAPQEKRGGGSVCFLNKYVWKAYADIIVDKDSCDSFDR